MNILSKMSWKKYAQKLKVLKFKEIKIFDSTFYFRYTVRTSTILILIWLGMVVFFNWNFLINSTSFRGYLFITQDVDSIRYLLSSAFQGLAALFALTISISFVAAQLTSNYSPRLVVKIVRKKWFVFGLVLFVVSLAYNLFLLSFVTNETVSVFKIWLLIGNVLDVASIIFIIPFVFLFIRATDPLELSQGLAEKFNDTFFENMTKKREVDDTLPLFQAIVIKGIENGDLDMVSIVLDTFFGQLRMFIRSDNYHLVATYFKPFFYKLIRKATEYKEDTILEQLIYSFEGVQNNITSPDFMKVSKFEDEYSNSMPHMIIFLMNESIRLGDGEMLGVGFGALTRLARKLVPQMPADDAISEIRLMKEMMKKNHGYRNSQEEYDNDNIFEYIENVFFTDEMVMLSETGIKMRNERATSRIIRHIYSGRHDILSLNAERIEVKKRIFGSLPYHLRKLMNIATENNINITDTIVTGAQELLREIVDLDIRTGEYYVTLMCDALMLMIKKGRLTSSPEWVVNMVGAAGRGIISKKDKNVKKIIEELIRTFKEVVLIVDNRSKESFSTEYGKIRNEIATQLKSFQHWGLKEVDGEMDNKLEEFLVQNWDSGFLKTLEK